MQVRRWTWAWRGALAAMCVATAVRAHNAPGRVRAAPIGSWQLIVPGTAAPAARSQFGLAADTSGNVYLYGGRDAAGVALADFWVFRAATGAWQQLPNSRVPALIEPHLAVDAAGNVLEFGGIGNPTQPNFSYDGHSYGLYRFTPGATDWTDVTSSGAEPGDNWPPGREDHGFAYDALDDRFYVYGGEGTADMPLNDMWSYDETTGGWSPVSQQFASPTGAGIDAREIYDISYDNHHGFYLFGGSYLTPGGRDGAIPTYVNDLWHFDVPSSTWTLVSGTANGYDPTLPVPRHYYGQACDANGNFYVLGGYVSDTSDPPYFEDDGSIRYAQRVQLQGTSASPQLLTFGLADFWFFSPGSGDWTDLSGQLGDLAGQAQVPYVMAADPANDAFVTFGGFHPQVPGGTLAMTNETWIYGLPAERGTMAAIPTLAPPTFTATATITATRTVTPPPTPGPGILNGALPRITVTMATDTPLPSPIRAAVTPDPGDDANPPR